MDPLSILLAMTLLFGSGYVTSEYFDEDKMCREIVHEVAYEYQNKHATMDCREDKNITCNIAKPRWVIEDEEYKKLSGYIGGMRLNLNACDAVIKRYNNDKFIMR